VYYVHLDKVRATKVRVINILLLSVAAAAAAAAAAGVFTVHTMSADVT
jgi:hypothetical protein